jgi:D-lactate dehydratase / protein deglycase
LEDLASTGKASGCVILSATAPPSINDIHYKDPSMSSADTTSREPEADRAEFNAFFPSPFSLSQFTAAKTGAQPQVYPDAQQDGRWKVLMVATEERYMKMANGKKFSTGNHPVETLLPMYHMDAAGFEVDVATVAGYPVKLEMWAMPAEDELVQGVHEKYLPKMEQPLKLADVVRNLGPDSPYIGVFLPGGHGAMLGLPESESLGTLLQWVMREQRQLITICHGPAALVAAGPRSADEDFVLKGYDICAFPDDIDRQTPAIGYIPGPMPWYMGDKLRPLGVNIINDDITGKCHQDRNVISGDSPLAADGVGRMAAKALINAAQRAPG